MKKNQKKNLQVQVDLKNKKYHLISQLSNTFFPYQPYSSQIKFIQTIQKSVSLKQNAIVQSPTGTGKTLCLLVGVLSGLVDHEDRKKIFYLTRTHSQIGQIVDQLKKTVYKCNVNIFASRELLCINRTISHLKGKLLQKACGEMCAQQLCQYKQSTMTKKLNILDLNQFKQTCKKQLVCPYFYSKKITQNSQITIMPFNYLLDWTLMQRNSINLTDAIIIFDQAHNIDKLSEEGSDIKITNQLLLQSIAELKTLYKLLNKNLLHKQFNDSDQKQQIQNIKQQLQSLQKNIFREEYTIFSKYDFITKIQQFTTTQRSNGIDLGNYRQFCFQIKNILKLIMKKQLTSDNLSLFTILFQKIFQMINKDKQFEKYNISIGKGQILLRCMDPSLCFQKIQNLKPKSIILSSGTLGNLDQWQKRLKIQFHHKISSQSFITKNQLYSQIKSKSQKGGIFNFSYQSKHNQKQYEQLCKEFKIIQQIVKQGIVVAFSSYQLLQKTVPYTNILNKKIFYQSKGSNIQNLYQNYCEQVRKNGAFIFIVMKGRFSQGINFSQDLCRCLIIVGIPFLPMKQPSVIQKMKYLQNNYSKAQAQKWYSQQSFRALNQTIGRAIRNKNDHAVILLYQNRYLKQQYLMHISKWFTSCLRPHTNTFSHIKQFLSTKFLQKDIISQIKQNTQTKKIKQPTLVQRLKQFETPNKKSKKKLKLVFQTEQKQQNNCIIMKQIEVLDDQQICYKTINKQLEQFFIQQIQDTLQKKETEEETTNISQIQTIKYRKNKVNLDF